jgi:hypothetical protein
MGNHDMENVKPLKRNYGTILTTPEAIVREHRKHWETIHHVDFKEPERLGPIGNFTKQNRGSKLEFVIWTLVIACFIYLSIFVFGPFLSKLIF